MLRPQTGLLLESLQDLIYFVCVPVFFVFFFTLLLSSFWTSHGHKCRPFFPPVLAFNFYRA